MNKKLLLLFLSGITTCYLFCQVNVSKRTDFVTGTVVKVIDGDTYDLLVGGKQTMRVRMYGIDAPERGMPYYKVSKQYLGKLCFRQQIRFQPNGKDVHSRNLGYTYLANGQEVGHLMVKAGLAWHFKRYNSEVYLANLETEARNARRGLWADKNPMAPWENRQLHRKGISTKKAYRIQAGQE